MDLCTLRMLHCPATVSRSGIECQPPTGLCHSRRGAAYRLWRRYLFVLVTDFHDNTLCMDCKSKPVESSDIGRGSLVSRDEEMFTTGWRDVVFGDDDVLAATDQDDTTCSVLVNTDGPMMSGEQRRIGSLCPPRLGSFTDIAWPPFSIPTKGTICSVHPKFVPDTSPQEDAKYPARTLRFVPPWIISSGSFGRLKSRAMKPIRS